MKQTKRQTLYLSFCLPNFKDVINIDKKNKFGIIYSVTNIMNNKKYIGQTTKSLKTRKQNHLSTIKRNDTAFQKAINKYGKEKFIWEIIDQAYSQEDLDNKEIFWIDYYNTYGCSGYNMTLGGQGANKATGLNRIEYLKTKPDDSHPFLIFDKYGNFIKECDNRLLFCEENDVRVGDSMTVLKNKKPSLNDYILIYIEDYSETNLKDRLKRIRYNRDFVVFDKNYQYIGTWSNQLLCERELGLKRGCINKCLTNVVRIINNHYFYYLDECPDNLKKLCV